MSAIAAPSLVPGWNTFGQVFYPGTARDAVQVDSLPTQTDVKCRWPDGSIKFAVVTVNVPEQEQSGGAGVYAVFDRSGGVSATLGGIKTKTVEVRFKIGNAVWVTSNKAYGTVGSWLSGDLVSEWRVAWSPVDAGGTIHPLIRVTCDCRHYADNAGQFDIAVENCLNKAGAAPILYDVQIVDTSTTPETVLFQQEKVLHPWLARWRFVVKWGLPSTGGYMMPDLVPAWSCGAIPRYLDSVGLNPITFGQTPWPILSCGPLNPYMGDVATRHEIAPLPGWYIAGIQHGYEEQLRAMYNIADTAAHWPVHLQEPDGTPFTIDKHPNFWLDSRAEEKPLGILGGLPTGYPANLNLRPDLAHCPSLAFVPYLLTGDRFYADEMSAWANYALLSTWQNKERNARGGSAGLLQSNQVRGIGWSLRNLADAAAFLPDADPLKPYFAAKVANNLKWLDDFADSCKSPCGATFDSRRPENGPGKPAVEANWEERFVMWAIDRCNKLGFSGGLKLRDRIGKQTLSLFTAGADFPREYAAPYLLAVGNRDLAGKITYCQSLKECFDLTNKLPTGLRKPTPFAGYYGPDARLALLIGVENGWPGAKEALDWLTPQILADLNKRPGWAIER